jgi:uncharacterized protein YrrD
LDVQEEIIMRTGKSLLGLNVVGQADGTALGKVRDLIFSPETDQVIALVLGEKDLFGLLDAQIVPWAEIQSVGQDTVLVRSAASNIKLKEYPLASESAKERETILSGTQLLTADGQRLGTLADTCIDEVTGQIVGYEVSGGFIADTLHGKKFLPSPPALSVGQDAAIVPPDAASRLK